MVRYGLIAVLLLGFVSGAAAQDEGGMMRPPGGGSDEERAARRAMFMQMMQERGAGGDPQRNVDGVINTQQPAPEGGEISTSRQPNSGSDTAVNWESITLKDCIEVLCRDLEMEFVISPSVNVSQEVSVRAGDVTQWEKNDKIELFDAILETAGVQRVERGRIWIFAPSDIRPVVEGWSKKEYSDGKPIIGVIRLKSVDATTAAEFLNTVGGKPQKVFSVKNSRMLLVLGTQQYLTQMEKLVELIDFPAGILKSYALSNASSDDVAEEMTSLFYGRIGGDGDEIRFVSVSRLNTVVAHNISESMIPEVDRWIDMLDRADDEHDRYSKVYRLQVIEAEVIAETLDKLYSELYDQEQEKQQLKTAASQKNSKANNAQAAAKQNNNNNNAKNNKKNSNAASTAPAASSPASAASSSAPGQTPSMDEEAIILADEDTNTLIVNATPDQHRDIERTIKELDQPRRQVLIETTMVEVTLDNSLSLGLEWAFAEGKSSVQVGSSDFSDALDLSGDGLSYLITSSASKMALIQMAESDDRLEVLSSPTVLTRDGMEAEVSFGEEVPVLESSVTDSGNENYSYDYRDATITLKVTPVIDDNRLVTLDLEQTFREVDPDYEASSSVDDYVAPTFTTRSLTSNLQVEDGQTLVLGGLIKREDQIVKTGIPILCRIPLIGWLFGSTSTDKVGSEILIIITPHVVENRAESDLMTDSYRRKVFGSLDVADVRKLYKLDDDEDGKVETSGAE